MKRPLKNTLIAFELNHGQRDDLILKNGKIISFQLISTSAEVFRTTVKKFKVEEHLGRTDYRFRCEIKVNGNSYHLEREVSTQKSFYEPWIIEGLQVWFDAALCISDFLTETHGECLPRRAARFAVQEAGERICPEILHPWCPLPEGGLKIEQCYTGEDCWLGAFNGASLHGGLDINHPPGTPLWAPFDIHEHFYFNSLEMGDNNNRWRGIHRWENGAEWIIQAHHMTSLTVPEHTLIKKGSQFANAAGVLSGEADHSHFVFKIHDHGETVFIDPWILFWQMYRDQQKA